MAFSFRACRALVLAALLTAPAWSADVMVSDRSGIAKRRQIPQPGQSESRVFLDVKSDVRNLLRSTPSSCA